MKRLFAYIQESRVELTKVSWPNRRQAVRLTLAVIVFSLVFSAIVGGLDYLFGLILQKVILKG